MCWVEPTGTQYCSVVLNTTVDVAPMSGRHCLQIGLDPSKVLWELRYQLQDYECYMSPMHTSWSDAFSLDSDCLTQCSDRTICNETPLCSATLGPGGSDPWPSDMFESHPNRTYACKFEGAGLENGCAENQNLCTWCGIVPVAGGYSIPRYELGPVMCSANATFEGASDGYVSDITFVPELPVKLPLVVATLLSPGHWASLASGPSFLYRYPDGFWGLPSWDWSGEYGSHGDLICPLNWTIADGLAQCQVSTGARFSFAGSRPEPDPVFSGLLRYPPITEAWESFSNYVPTGERIGLSLSSPPRFSISLIAEAGASLEVATGDSCPQAKLVSTQWVTSETVLLEVEITAKCQPGFVTLTASEQAWKVAPSSVYVTQNATLFPLEATGLTSYDVIEISVASAITTATISVPVLAELADPRLASLLISLISVLLCD